MQLEAKPKSVLLHDQESDMSIKFKDFRREEKVLGVRNKYKKLSAKTHKAKIIQNLH